MNIFKKFNCDKTDSEVLDFIAYFDNIENHFSLKYLLILLYYYRYENIPVAVDYVYECIELKESVELETYNFFISKIQKMHEMPDEIKCITSA